MAVCVKASPQITSLQPVSLAQETLVWSGHTDCHMVLDRLWTAADTLFTLLTKTITINAHISTLHDNISKILYCYRYDSNNRKSKANTPKKLFEQPCVPCFGL